MMARSARVTAAYATVPVVDPASSKPTVYGFYAGAILPPTADPSAVAGLVRRDYAEWVDDEPVSEPDSGQEPDESDKPAANAPKSAWVDYAVAKRADGVSEEDARAEAEGKTKADLVAEYGG